MVLMTVLLGMLVSRGATGAALGRFPGAVSSPFTGSGIRGAILPSIVTVGWTIQGCL